MIPAPLPTRQARSRETVERLLAAADTLFAQRGIDAVTIADLCAEADIGVGTFYGRFRDKSSFLAVYFGAYYEQAKTSLDEDFPPDAWAGLPAADIIAAWIERRVVHFRRRRGLIRAVLGYARTHDDAGFRAAAATFACDTVDRLQVLLSASSDPPPGDLHTSAPFLISLIEALLKELALHGERRSPSLSLRDETLAADLTRAACGYLAIPGPP